VTKSFFQLPNGKMWSPKSVSKTFPLQKTQAKIIGCHWLAGKIFAINVIRNQTSVKSSFDSFDRSALPPFDSQRISTSNFLIF